MAPWRSVRYTVAPMSMYLSSTSGWGSPYQFPLPTEMTMILGDTALMNSIVLDELLPWWGDFKTVEETGMWLAATIASTSLSISPVRRKESGPLEIWRTRD